MPRNNQDPEQAKGDSNKEGEDEDQRDTIPEQRVTRPEEVVDDEEKIDDAVDIDLDELPEFEGPDA